LEPGFFARRCVSAGDQTRENNADYRQKNLTAAMIAAHRTAEIKKAETRPANFIM